MTMIVFWTVFIIASVASFQIIKAAVRAGIKLAFKDMLTDPTVKAAVQRMAAHETV